MNRRMDKRVCGRKMGNGYVVEIVEVGI